MSHWTVLCVARFSSYRLRLIHEDVENLKLRIVVVGTGHQQISFLFSQFGKRFKPFFTKAGERKYYNIITRWGLEPEFFCFFPSVIKRVKSRLYTERNQSCRPLLLNLVCHLAASDEKWPKVISWERKVDISRLKYLLPQTISWFKTLSMRWWGNIDRMVYCQVARESSRPKPDSCCPKF